MTLFQSIRSLLFPPKRTGLPLNITPNTLVALKNLQASADWPAYQSLLDSIINLYAEQLLSTDDDAAVHRLRGFILGLRKAGTLVTETIRQQEYEDAARTKLDQRATAKRNDTELALYGTRYGTHYK